MIEDLKGFAVHPKLDCPHLSQKQVNSLCQFLLNSNKKHFSQFQCVECKDKNENWICLECHTLGCSRYVSGHMATHNQNTKHSIALSFSDSSFWCYDCESYIDDPALVKARKEFSKSKFSEPLDEKKKEQEGNESKGKQAGPEKSEEQKISDLVDKIDKLDIKQPVEAEAQSVVKTKQEYYQEVIQKLKNKTFKKVVFLTGAGLSVAAGIPDFRTPGTGLYDQLAKYNLPRPESVFELVFYAKNPKPFIKLSKEWLDGNFQPTKGHKFIKKCEDENILHYCMTQNIDDLQTKAGLSPQKLLQAHGHSRSAHCIKCKKEEKIEKWIQFIKIEEPLNCSDVDCRGLIKPDIVFFGEQLPQSFALAPDNVEQADLVFVIGTSLVVWPFAHLAHMVPQKTPLVLINNTDSLAGRKNKIWLDGDIEENINKICTDLGWVL